MIQLDPYSVEFEEEYWKAVDHRIDDSKKLEIIKSCKEFLPDGFFSKSTNEFKSLILIPFDELKAAEHYIRKNKMKEMNTECFDIIKKKTRSINTLYKHIHDSYTQLANSTVNGTSMRVRIVIQAGLTVCPYCNRDYINCRAKSVSGAQLDHFFSKSKYPLFAVCLYNLVPVCGNCNRIKGSTKLTFTSPFDTTIDWDKDLTFTYTGTNLNDMNIKVTAEGNLKNNINKMRIEEAYKIHSTEVLDLIEREQIYNSSQKKELIEVLGPENLTDADIKKIIFGPKITKESMRTKPLGKMMYDLHKELRIYNQEK